MSVATTHTTVSYGEPFAVAPARNYSAEEFANLSDSKGYELVDGHIKEKGMGAQSSRIAVALSAALNSYLEARALGDLFDSECGYQCFSQRPNLVRKPDISFVKSGRLPNDQLPPGWIRVAPDLAIEVVSPNETAEEINAKIEDYLGAGVRLIWVISPATRTVHIYRLNGSTARLRESDDLDGEDVIPGFRYRVEQLFRRSAASPPANP
jgi:Uma2 family endonuclease